MSDADENKQLIRDMIDTVWHRGDLEKLPQYWSSDCVNHAAPGDPVGLTALAAYHQEFAGQLTGFSEVSIAVLQQLAEDDRVVSYLATSARHTGEFAGLPATGRTASLFTIRIDRIVDGKIVEHWSVADVAGLLNQLGSTSPA